MGIGDRPISIRKLSILLSISIIGIFSISFSVQDAFGAHVTPSVITVGPTTGVIATDFQLADPAGIFVSCDIPNMTLHEQNYLVLIYHW